MVVLVVAGEVSSGLSSRPASGLDLPHAATSTTGTASNATRRNRLVTVRTVPGLPTAAEDTAPCACEQRGWPNRHEVAASSRTIVPESTSCFDESWLPSASSLVTVSVGNWAG